MTSSNNTSGEHQIYKVQQWERLPHTGTQYFSVYWEHGHTGLKYVFPNIIARDELEAYTIGLQKLKEGAD
jgi:hypothetical protein